MGIDLWREINGGDAVPLDRLALQSSWELSYGALPEWLSSQTVAQQSNVQPTVTRFVIVSEWRADDSSAMLLFAGETGILLDAMLKAIALSRDQVGLIGLTDPNNEGTTANLTNVLADLPLKAVLFMSALPKDRSVDSFIARSDSSQTLMGVPLIASLHPAYLLTNPQSKRSAWGDLKRVRALLTR